MRSAASCRQGNLDWSLTGYGDKPDVCIHFAQRFADMTYVHIQQCHNPRPFSAQQPVTVGRTVRGIPGHPLFQERRCAQMPAFGPGQLQGSRVKHLRTHQSPRAAEVLYELADIDAKTAATIASLLGPVLNLGQLLMIARIVLSWYPNINYGKLPWVLAVRPTEPILAPTRKVIPIVGGLDVTPIVWVALLSFINEILLGPQGILNLLQRKADL